MEQVYRGSVTRFCMQAGFEPTNFNPISPEIASWARYGASFGSSNPREISWKWWIAVTSIDMSVIVLIRFMPQKPVPPFDAR